MGDGLAMGSPNVSHREVILAELITLVLCGIDVCSKYVCMYVPTRFCMYVPARFCIFTLQGKIEMEMEILTELEAKSRPAGRGRGEPNNNPFLPEPKYI